MKKHRITIIIQDDLHKKLRNVQGDMIKKSQVSVSFSGVIESVLWRGLK